MKSLTWLHISDLHLTPKDTYNQDRVLNPLLISLEERFRAGWRPDAVFCTGDVAKTGGAGAPQFPEYATAAFFLDRLLEKLHLPKERLFVVPGNHDVDRSQVPIFNLPDSAEEADEVLSDVRQVPALMLRFRGFQSFVQTYLGREFCPDGKPFSLHRFETADGLKVGVIELNSAWNAIGDQDHGSLMVSERAVWESTEKLKDNGGCDVTVALIHHPLDWLSWWDLDRVSALLEEKVDLLLRGHLHSTRIDNVTTQFGNMVQIATGAAYQTRRWTNRVVLGKLDADSRMVWTTPLRFEDRGSGGWSVEWSPSRANPTQVWRVNPPAERCTVLIQEGLWSIAQEPVLSALDSLTPAAPPSVITLGHPVEDWEAAQSRQTAWYKAVATTTSQTPRFAVFSSAPVPLAIHLGYMITDRYPVTFHQWDRDRHTWSWENTNPPGWDVTTDNLPNVINRAQGPAAVCVSVSATVSEEDVRAVLPDAVSVIHLRVPNPNVMAITNEHQVQVIGKRFREVMEHIRHYFPGCTGVHLFAAVPTGVAINLGRQISHTMDPAVHLYQYNHDLVPANRKVLVLADPAI